MSKFALSHKAFKFLFCLSFLYSFLYLLVSLALNQMTVKKGKIATSYKATSQLLYQESFFKAHNVFYAGRENLRTI